MSEKEGKSEIKAQREGKSEGFVEGFHLCLGVGDRIGSSLPREGLYTTVFGWKHPKKMQTGGESGEPKRRGEGPGAIRSNTSEADTGYDSANSMENESNIPVFV